MAAYPFTLEQLHWKNKEYFAAAVMRQHVRKMRIPGRFEQPARYERKLLYKLKVRLNSALYCFQVRKYFLEFLAANPLYKLEIFDCLEIAIFLPEV